MRQATEHVGPARTALILLLLVCSCAFTPPQPEAIAAADIGPAPPQAECEATARNYWAERAARLAFDDAQPAIAAIGPLERGWYRAAGEFRFAWALPVSCAKPGGTLVPVQFYFLGPKLVAWATGNQHRAQAQMDGGGRTARDAGLLPPPREQPQAGADGWVHTGR